MNSIDFIVLFGTMLSIVLYGIWKTRKSHDLQGYLLGDNSMKWGTIGLSVMATQASAITFLSTPGQAYQDGMGFIQFYFGMPLAMIILSAVVVPLYYKLKVFTAYEFLEQRFDLKSRALTAFLFLISRGLAAGITIYAPAIILTSILNWDINITILIIGVVVIIYTVSGGTKAVAETQKQQMVVIMGGMLVAFIVLLTKLPENVGLNEALTVAGKMGKMDMIDWEFDPANRYNIWSGMVAALFLFLAYFGTDQSQVQRYLSGKSIKEIRLGLLFNGAFKIPMQFSILLVGVLVFIFYQFTMPPMFFNQTELDKLENSKYEQEYSVLKKEHQAVFEAKRAKLEAFVLADKAGDNIKADALSQDINKLNAKQDTIKANTVGLMQQVNENLDTKDSDYVFITFIMNYLPHGLIGLLIAVIFSAAMSSTSSELNALASTTIIDFYKRMVNSTGSDAHYLFMTRLFTAFWGVLALMFAMFASQLDNLIQAVNILGSVFYGPILGIFIVAFGVKYVKANAVFIATFVSEGVIIWLYFLTRSGDLGISYLWFNPIGALLVVFIAIALQTVMPKKSKIIEG
ncbi:Sodium iodide symporter [hydrothermal vent metagenome]|uniref:Sodium iodide symporter n=1 Tax=hydrothermal vent metagenome TaxID=652676 RepID=A0A3B0V3F0_9ZZZZ